jgi:hypothetical protein
MLQRANYNKIESLPYISNPASAGLQLAAGSFNFPLPSSPGRRDLRKGERIFFDLAKRLLLAEIVSICISYRQFLKSIDIGKLMFDPHPEVSTPTFCAESSEVQSVN